MDYFASHDMTYTGSLRKQLLSGLLLWLTLPFAAYAINCHHWPAMSQKSCLRLQRILSEGHKELYLTGYAWHNRFTYSKERWQHYNENAWGGGIGKSVYDEKNNWHGLYAFAFLDSHRQIEPIAGYAYLKMAYINPAFKLGGGFSVFITSRADYFNHIPFPGALPWLSLSFQRLSLSATYVPGHSTGNVLFVFARWVL